MKILLFFMFLLFFTELLAQDTLLILDKKFKTGTNTNSFRTLTSVNEKSGEVHLTLVDNKSIERYTIDSNWKITDQFSSSRGMYSEFPYERFNNMKVINSNGKEYAFYKTGDRNIFINQIDFVSKKELKHTKIELDKDETIVSYFTSSNIFYLITALKKNNTLKLITNARQGGILFDTITIDLNNEKVNLLSNLMNYVPIIRPYEDRIEKLASPDKIYYSNDNIYISIEVGDQTYITEVNLKTAEIKHKIFKQQLYGDADKNLKDKAASSYLYKGALVTANLFNQVLTVSLYDYETGKLVKKYEIKENDIISFKNGPVFNPDGWPLSKSNFTFDKDDSINHNEPNAEAYIIRHFFKGLKKGLAIKLENTGNGQLKLFTESYLKQANRGSPTVGNTVPAIAGGVLAVAVMNNFSYLKDKYITSLLAEKSFDHISSVNTKCSSELINDALPVSSDINTQSIFIINNFLYLGFYNSKNEKFVIRRIKSID